MDVIRNLALPAKVYLALSALGIISTLLTKPTPNKEDAKIVALVIQILSVFAWTWIIDLIYNAGWTKTAWVLALLPIIVIALLLLAVIGAFAGRL